MNYSDITVNDPNPIKRYLQRSRYRSAVDLYPDHSGPKRVLDFGGGDGELCLQLAQRDQSSHFLCYEPAVRMRELAARRIQSEDRITLIDNLDGLATESCDIVYSLEVFEHLPAAEFTVGIEQMFRVLRQGGTLVIGVPNELYLAALYKGVFRMLRRFGDYDARPRNILRCAIGRPPKDRPMGEISPGKRYHFHHLGFDHRVLKQAVKLNAGQVSTEFSPIWFLGAIASPEIYFIASKPRSAI